ncbi:MAG: putative DNA-binding domain-containing protein [Gammaproteobacteria bacterium]|nr:putative DNA-binding domain-containing protein [Gammaproteobacteria bacterium]
MKNLVRDFKTLQYEFSAHLRHPDKNPAPADVEDRRMKIYRELFYNNLENFIATGFPVLRKLYSDADWHAMVRDFMHRHQNHSPYFLEIAQEFLYFLNTEHIAKPCDPPFLHELAHYEWIEIALSVQDETNNFENINPNANLLHTTPILSSLACLLSYQWPVHQLSPDYQPQEPPAQITHLIVYRDRQDLIHFINLNPVTARLVQLIQNEHNAAKLTGQQILEKIALELQHPNPMVVLQGGTIELQKLQAAGVILGGLNI